VVFDGPGSTTGTAMSDRASDARDVCATREASSLNHIGKQKEGEATVKTPQP